MNDIHLFRGRFARDIVAEFLPPRKPSRRVMILCDGVPSLPSKKQVALEFSRRGYWVFHPRYRGTWESRGFFLKHAPADDIRDLLGALPQGFQDIWAGKKFRLSPTDVTLVASSFGGAAALCASVDPRITRVVAFAPVVDWKEKSPVEPLRVFRRIIEEGYGGAYRIQPEDWKRFARGTYYAPRSLQKQIDGKKIFLIHAKNDDVVTWQPVARFATQIGATLKLVSRGGHFSLSAVLEPRFQKFILPFLRRSTSSR